MCHNTKEENILLKFQVHTKRSPTGLTSGSGGGNSSGIGSSAFGDASSYSSSLYSGTGSSRARGGLRSPYSYLHQEISKGISKCMIEFKNQFTLTSSNMLNHTTLFQLG